MKNNVLKKVLAVIVALAVAAAAFTAGFFTYKLTQDKKLASYEWFIETIEKNYYYGGAEDGYTETGLSEIAEKYLDRYSEYYTAEEYAETMKSNSGSKSGLGLGYSFIQGEGVYISTVTGNSPAYMSGLRAGERLLSGSADGRGITFKSASDFAQLIALAGDGEIKLSGSGGEEYTLCKAEYTASYTSLSTNKTAWVYGDAETGGLALYERPSEKISYLPDDAGYIRLSQFYGTASAEFYRLIEKFNSYNLTSLIIDLRSNGGGYVKVMQEIAGSFAEGSSKTAMISRDKHGRETVFRCSAVKNAEYRVKGGTDVYVLANAGTASASEALIGALVCYGALDYKNIFISEYSEGYVNWLKNAGQEVKNARTYGKGIMQSTFVNDSTKEALKLTTAQIYWPDGQTCIHDRGLTADDGCTPSGSTPQPTKNFKGLLK